MKKPELLSPAGNRQCLEAAIEAGCDAVYLGGKVFGARNFALNFNNEELIDAIKYAHINGVKVYVTVNTLIYDSEVDEFLKYIEFLHKNNVDAIIIQDLGMFDLVRKTFPNLEIHASTQMHIHNLEGALLAKKLGFKRVVIARETSIDDLKRIKKANIDIEIFIHGALCVSYSGQCLMSSMIGGRSGNRGTCAQCCRLKYDLISNNKKINKDNYILSTKDLCTINQIGELIDIGIDSLKIEGRMKRPEYVYLVTSIYRKAIDNYLKVGKTNITLSDIYKLEKIFNREFTKGFLFNEDNNNFTHERRPNHIGVVIGEVVKYKNNKVTIRLTQNISKNDGIRIITDKQDVGGTLLKFYKNNKEVIEAYPNDLIEFKMDGNIKKGNLLVKTSDYKDIEEIKHNLKNKTRKVMINGFIKCHLNKKIELTLNDGINEVTVLSKNNVEKALKVPTSKETILKQIEKLGNTIYKFDKLDTDIEENIFINIKDINELRRDAIEELNKKRLYNYDYKKDKYSIKLIDYEVMRGFNYLVNNIDDYNKIKNKKYVNIYTENKELLNLNEKIILKLPRVITKYNDYNQKLLIGEIGSLYKYKDVYTDFSLNVTNSYTVAFLHALGVSRVTLSYEMNDIQIENLIKNYINRYNKRPNLELIVKSTPEVMVSKYNLLKKYNIENNNNYLCQKNKKFKIVTKNDLMYIYNFEKIDKKDYQKYFDMGINYLRIEF